MSTHTAAQGAPIQRGSHLALRRASAAFLLILLAVGCVLLWVGVPAGAMWLAGTLTDSFAYHMPMALALVIPGMFLTAIVLIWINELYLRITGGEIVRHGEFEVRRRGPLEPLVVVSLLIAIVALFVWFFFFAHNPSSSVFG